MHKRILVVLFAGCLLLVPTLQAQQSLPSSYTFQECDALEEAALRAELNSIAQQALRAEDLDISRIVEQRWIQYDVGAVIDSVVDQASARARKSENYFGRLWSGWSPEKANEVANKVANDAFGSEEFREAIERLSQGIAESVVEKIEIAAAQSASSALSCLQAFIGGRYSNNMVAMFEGEIRQDLDKADFAAQQGQIGMAQMHSTALAGVGVIIGTQIAKRLARKLTQRIAGRVATRIVGRGAVALVPVAGWVVGLGLIAWDLVEGADGALPQVQASLKSDEVKREIQKEVAAAVAPELEKELPKIARQVSNDVYSTWLEFKKQYAMVLKLAEREPAFREILDNAANEDIFRLSRLVSVSLETVGQEQLDAAIRSGLFARLLALPESAAKLLGASRSYDTVIAWSERAGGQLDALTELEIHKLKSPDEVDKETLAALVALDDKAAVAKLLVLDDEHSAALLGLPSDTLRRLAKRFGEDDLGWLASYLAVMDEPRQRKPLVNRLLQRPALMETLKDAGVRDAVAASDDVDATLDFVTAPPSLASALGDAFKLLGGSISFQLFWQKYGSAKNVAIVAGLLSIFILWRLLRRRARTKVVVVQAPPRER